MRRFRGIEKRDEAVINLLAFYDIIIFGNSVTGIIIFFEDKILTFFELFPDIKLEDLLNIRFYIYLPVKNAYIIPNKLGFKILTDNSLIIKFIFIYFFRRRVFDKIIGLILFAGYPRNPGLFLRSFLSGILFIAKPEIFKILEVINLEYSFIIYNPGFGEFTVYIFDPGGYEFINIIIAL